MSKKKAVRTKKQKSHTLEYLVYAVVILVIIWAIYSFVQSPQGPPPTTYVGEGSTAPDFTLSIVDENGLTNDRLTLSQFKGKVVVLEFMLSTCPHCQNMAPTIKKLYQDYGAQNVVIISVAGTANGADAVNTAQFIRAYGSTWFHVFDQRNTVFNTYGVSSTPTYFIIDLQGIVRFRITGEQPYSDLAQAIDRILKP